VTTANTTQVVAEVPSDGAAPVLVSQSVAEVPSAGSTATVSASMVFAETITSSTNVTTMVGTSAGAATVSGIADTVVTTKLQATQAVSEVPSDTANPPLLASQIVSEVPAAPDTSPLLVSQSFTEVVTTPDDQVDIVGTAAGAATVEAQTLVVKEMVGTAAGHATVLGEQPIGQMVGTSAGRATVSGITIPTTAYVVTFPPVKNTAIQNTINSYLYVQYNDDDDMQAFVGMYNAYTQAYLNWFNNLGLPVYTQGNITGSLLDWVAQGLYGIRRPGLPTEGSPAVGPFNTYAFNTLAFNQLIPAVTQAYYATTDDTFKRIITWLFFKGDGHQMNIRWLKRRIARFLNGVGGTSYNVDQTYDISVAFTGPQAVTITVPTGSIATILQAAIDAGVLELPFQITWAVVLA
jgi:hypothetical protein